MFFDKRSGALQRVCFRGVPFGLAFVCVFVVAGCHRRPNRVVPPSIDPQAAGEAAVKQYDSNGDGVIGGEELEMAPSLKHAAQKIDRSGDGLLSAQEIGNRIREWEASKMGRMVVTCKVTRGGNPLAGATVKYVPEKFLGGKVKTATGVTDENGLASLSAPTSANDPPGVAPGFYRVEITKEGEGISSKCNTETTLGQEVAIDAGEMVQMTQRVVVFEVD